MISDDEYHEMLLRISELCGIDPEPDSELGRELIALTDMVMEYERVKFPMKEPPA